MTYNLLKDTLVQLPLGRPALPELLVVVVEALPVLAELLEAGLVDVVETAKQSNGSAHTARLDGASGDREELAGVPRGVRNIHASCAAGDSPALLQALELALAGVLGLALHVVIVVVAAAGADEERCGQEGSGAGADLIDLGDRVGQGGGIVENLLVEAAEEGQSKSSGWGRSPLGRCGINWPVQG